MGKKFEYPADDVKVIKEKRVQKDCKKTRAGLKPGSVVILLSGKHQGKRAVFLKQLKSGLLAVTGPFKYNGVPLRRVNQRYVIPTSTTVEVGNAQSYNKISDDFFLQEKKAQKKLLAKAKGEQDFFEEKARKESISDDFRKVQAEVDKSVKVNDILMKKYLGARFSLSNNDCPHLMQF